MSRAQGDPAGAEAVQVVLVTAPDLEVAGRIGRSLVEEGLAACANLVPGVRSVYRWQGEVHEDPEVLLIVKTRAALVAALEARVRELHPYEVPEVLALDVAAGSAPYLEWVRDAARGAR
jgi:periplasmic divalent cation tolerance protein